MKKTIHALTLSLIVIIVLFQSCKVSNKIKSLPDATDHAQMTSEPTTSMLPGKANWVQDLSMSEEFNDGLDTSKWTTQHWLKTNGVFVFKPANATVSDGNLHIWAKKETYQDKEYTAGYIRSKFNIGENAYIEVRAKMIDHKANVNSAIWLYDKPKPEVKPNVEIDMQEYLRPLKKPKEIHSSFHLWYKEPNSHIALSNIDWNYTVNLDEGYHLYGLERRNGRVTFYIDGIRHWSYNATFLPDLVTQPRPLIFNVNGNAGKPVDEYLSASMMVDYIRVYTVN